jgi:hypothetical protein
VNARRLPRLDGNVPGLPLDGVTSDAGVADRRWVSLSNVAGGEMLLDATLSNDWGSGIGKGEPKFSGAAVAKLLTEGGVADADSGRDRIGESVTTPPPNTARNDTAKPAFA